MDGTCIHLLLNYKLCLFDIVELLLVAFGIALHIHSFIHSLSMKASMHRWCVLHGKMLQAQGLYNNITKGWGVVHTKKHNIFPCA